MLGCDNLIIILFSKTSVPTSDEFIWTHLWSRLRRNQWKKTIESKIEGRSKEKRQENGIEKKRKKKLVEESKNGFNQDKIEKIEFGKMITYCIFEHTDKINIEERNDWETLNQKLKAVKNSNGKKTEKKKEKRKNKERKKERFAEENITWI